MVAGVERVLNHVDAAELGPDRTLMLPSISTSPRQLYDAAARLAAAHQLPLGPLSEEVEEVAERICRGMGSRSDGSRAQALGLPIDESADSIVRGYAEDFVLGESDGGACGD